MTLAKDNSMVDGKTAARISESKFKKINLPENESTGIYLALFDMYDLLSLLDQTLEETILELRKTTPKERFGLFMSGFFIDLEHAKNHADEAITAIENYKNRSLV